MRRILLGDVGAIAALGLRELLENEEEYVIVGECKAGADVPARVEETKPDVLILDAAAFMEKNLRRRLRRVQPAITLVGCSLAEPMIHVRSANGVEYSAVLSPESLRDAVSAA